MTVSFDDDAWELYHIETDFSQAIDLAAEQPGRLRELRERFLAEAAKYNVLPLDDRFAQRVDPALRPSLIAGQTSFVFWPGTIRVPEPCAPNTKNVYHTIGVELRMPDGGAAGALVSCGGESGGYTLFIHDGHLVWEHNWFNEIRYRVTSADPIPAGHQVVSAEIRVDDNTPGTGGNVTLRLGQTIIGQGRFDQQIPYRFTVNETFDIGCSTITPVSDLYRSPATFTGTIERIMIDTAGAAFDDLATRARIAMALQ